MMIDIPKYISAQLRHFFPFPDTQEADRMMIAHVLPQTCERYQYCASKIKSFNGSDVDLFDVRKYPIFLYFLYHNIHSLALQDETRIKDRLYCLNRYLHGCSLFYKLDLPRVFFLSYASSIILGTTTYGENFVAFPGSTVGAYNNHVAIIGSQVVLMPNVIVSGKSVVGDNVVISTGVRVINQQIPDNTLVFQGPSNSLVFKENDGSYIRSYLQV